MNIYASSNKIYASASALLITLSTNVYPQWSVDTDTDFVTLKFDTTVTTATAAFGYGSNTGNEQTHSLVYIEAEDAAVVTFYEQHFKYEYVTKVVMATGGAAWSKKVLISSTLLSSRYLDLDRSTDTLYFTSDFSRTYLFICKMRSSDGVATYCAKYGGDGEDYAYFLKIFGDYLLVHGSSTSSEFKSSSDLGNFVLWLHKDLRNEICE